MTQKKPLAVVIMAAGKGTRMKSELPKVLIEVAGKPMLEYVIEAARTLDPQTIVVVTGYKREMLVKRFASAGVTFTIQEPQLGTGHAVAQAEETLTGFAGDILVLSGDVPLIRPATLAMLYEAHRQTKSTVTVLTCHLDDPASYGRIVRKNSDIVGNIEAKDATEEQLEITEINSGIYLFDSSFLFAALKRVDNQNAQGEYYLTDLLAMAVSDGCRVEAITCADPTEIMGANRPEDLLALGGATTPNCP